MIVNRKSNLHASHAPYPAHAHGAMHDVQNLDTCCGNAVNDQMRVENDVAVLAAFGGDMAAGRVVGVKDFSQVRFVISRRDYFFWFKSHCDIRSCTSDMGINSPASMCRIYAINSSCVASNGKFGFQPLETDTSGSAISLYIVHCILFNSAKIIKNHQSKI